MNTPQRATTGPARKLGAVTAASAIAVATLVGSAGVASATPGTPTAERTSTAGAMAQDTNTASPGERIVDSAAAQEGKPYSFGADGPESFDCSGLTQYAHQQAGIDLPRTTGQQRAATPTIDRSEMSQGDIVFFHNGDGSVYHAGIYAGDNQIWHASQPGEPVHRTELWTTDYSVGRAR